MVSSAKEEMIKDKLLSKGVSIRSSRLYQRDELTAIDGIGPRTVDSIRDLSPVKEIEYKYLVYGTQSNGGVLVTHNELCETIEEARQYILDKHLQVVGNIFTINSID